ncbi:MAG: PHP domain-containing protein [Spirochaetales bacterium]|nr:PHP domain-containing protein [Spirochaetales bacterium]
MFDFHTHSTASDGTLSPNELLTYGKSRNVEVIALTDHDTIDGLEEGASTARQLDMTFIPGIELDIAVTHGTFHLLGLGIDSTNDQLVESLIELQENRERRNKKIVKKMNAMGIRCTWDEVLAESVQGVVGRPHMARLLIKKGWAKDIPDAFDRFLARGAPLYEPKPGLDIQRALKIIHEAGGLAMLAHPQSLQLNWGPLTIELRRLKAMGLDGVESHHSGLSFRDGQKVVRIAAELDLLESGGSDFHSREDRGRKIGKTFLEAHSVPETLGLRLLFALGVR